MSAPVSSNTNPTDSDDDGGGTNTSSVLFFVALGIGVVFANLFAFMGIRYCCRRRRHPEQFTQAAQAAAAARSRYRARGSRKKKPKLMTLDQVNEKFPELTFKQARTEQPASSPKSSMDIEQTMVNKEEEEVDEALKTRQSVDIQEGEVFDHSPDVEAQQREKKDSHDDHVEETFVGDSDSDNHSQNRVVDDDVLAAVEQEDMCAVCIEQMENEDRVRLLSCGHIFHSECIDPWLTVRRACCPLCKADYYVPKPQAETSQEDEDGVELQRRMTSQASDTQAARRRRANALYNIWGRRHHHHHDGQGEDGEEGQGNNGTSTRMWRLPRIRRPRRAHTRDSQPQPESTTTAAA